MKINTLLGTAMLGLLVLSIANSAVLYIQNESIQKNNEIMITDQILLKDIGEMYAMGLQTGQAARNVLINPKDEQAKKNYRNAHEEFLKSQREAASLATGSMKDLLGTILEMWSKDHELKTAVQQHAVSGHPDDAIALLNQVETPLWRALKEKLFEMRKIQEIESAKRVAEVQQAIRRAGVMNIANFVLVILILTGTWFLFQKKIIKPINRLAKGLADGTDQVASAAEQVASASQTLAEGTSEQASSIEETSSSLEEMSSMTRQNAQHTGQVNTLMVDVQKVVGEANASMNQLTGSMSEISKASEETFKIIKTIDEIAFQTNLLALNAAVEAARAGEAGAGFAVVADEVRNLAMRAAEAAKNTSGMIEETVKKVRDGSVLVSHTNDAFRQVETSSARIAELIGEVATASNEQAQGIEQVNMAVTEMDKVTQHNAATAEETASASEQLSAQAEQMKSMVNQIVAMAGGNRDTGKNQRMPASHDFRKKSAGKRIMSNPAKDASVSVGNVSKTGVVGPEQLISMDENELSNF